MPLQPLQPALQTSEIPPWACSPPSPTIFYILPYPDVEIPSHPQARSIDPKLYWTKRASLAGTISRRVASLPSTRTAPCSFVPCPFSSAPMELGRRCIYSRPIPSKPCVAHIYRWIGSRWLPPFVLAVMPRLRVWPRRLRSTLQFRRGRPCCNF